MTSFVSLSFNERCVDQATSGIGQSHELGVASTTSLSHGLCGSTASGIGRALVHQDVSAIHQAHQTADSAREDLQDFESKAVFGPAAVPAVNGGVRPEPLWQVTPGPCVAQAIEQAVQ
ncbi:hypothetical protein [Roseimicrobium sp. ORNL1]|uniref:hypothetical protein n=1 Tax=Roseimicrobium sp. ORNL1 TaxID=2711231 RepID=UPI001F118D9D|nr:hypothetical protein [Roseimicrobium sp. ORNL1]